MKKKKSEGLSKTIVHCAECATVFSTAEDDWFCPLEEVKHLLQRIAPGELVPAGECVHCGHLVYIAELDHSKAQEAIADLGGFATADVQPLQEHEAALDVVREGAWCNIRVFLNHTHLNEILKENE